MATSIHYTQHINSCNSLCCLMAVLASGGHFLNDTKGRPVQSVYAIICTLALAIWQVVSQCVIIQNIRKLEYLFGFFVSSST